MTMTSQWVIVSPELPDEAAWLEVATDVLWQCSLVEWVGGAHQIVDAVGSDIITWWEPVQVQRPTPVSEHLDGVAQVPAGSWWTDVRINDSAHERALKIAESAAERCRGRLLVRS